MLIASRTLDVTKCQSIIIDSGHLPFPQFDLVCDKAVYASMSSSLIFAGWFVALLLVSSLSDKYGRKKLAFINGALIAVSALIAAFSVDYWMFVAFRVLIGFGIGT